MRLCSLQEVIRTICSPYGFVQRVVVFRKNGLQVLVEYPENHRNIFLIYFIIFHSFFFSFFLLSPFLLSFFLLSFVYLFLFVFLFLSLFSFFSSFFNLFCPPFLFSLSHYKSKTPIYCVLCFVYLLSTHLMMVSCFFAAIFNPPSVVVLHSSFRYDSIPSAQRAKSQLDGADIYAGCCTLKIEYAKVCIHCVQLILMALGCHGICDFVL